MEGKALQFLAYVRPVLIESNRDPNFIYNMDQTPVQMAMDWKVTIDKVGARMVNLRTSASETKRVTVAVTLGWEFRFGIPFPGTTGIRNSASDFGVPELSGGKANRKT